MIDFFDCDDDRVCAYFVRSDVYLWYESFSGLLLTSTRSKLTSLFSILSDICVDRLVDLFKPSRDNERLLSFTAFIFVLYLCSFLICWVGVLTLFLKKNSAGAVKAGESIIRVKIVHVVRLEHQVLQSLLQ